MLAPAARLRLLALGAVLTTAAALLGPLTHGAFLLDDLPNLAGLERVAREPDGFASFVWGGAAGPTGRPLALMSFALQAEDWPGYPAPFKRVNLLLHVTVGGALYALWSRLLRRRLPEGDAQAVALGVTALWLVHPLQLSTVAYVVQRMTLLAALGVVVGLLAFVSGRERVARAPEDPRGPLLALGGLGLGGLLALGAKESGVLILPLAIVIDHLLFPAAETPPRWRAIRRWTMHAPLALGALALVAVGCGWLANSYAACEFTLGERLLSQPRALADYALHCLLPLRDGLGVFHDDFALSRGAIEPWTTLPALALVGAAIAAIGVLRARAPLVAFSLAWFLANHLLESTLLPLDPYFEHRNYLALAGLLTLPLLALLALWRARRALPAFSLAAAYAVAVAWQGSAEARSWGDPLGLAQRWSAEHPGSLRAQSYLANLHKVRGELDESAAVYRAHDARFADGVSFTLDWLELGCERGAQPLPPLALVLERAASARFSYGPPAALDRMVGRFERGEPCARVALGELARIDAALLANPRYQRDAYLFELLAARIARQAGDGTTAAAALRRAFDDRPEPDYALAEAAWQLEAGEVEAAAAALARAQAALGANPLRRQALAPRIAALEQEIAARRIPKAD